MNYILINKMTTKAGKRDEVIDILLRSGKQLDDNNDCLLYMVGKDDHNENTIWVQDIWKTEQSHRMAMRNPNILAYVDRAEPLIERMPEQFTVIPSGGKTSIVH